MRSHLIIKLLRSLAEESRFQRLEDRAVAFRVVVKFVRFGFLLRLPFYYCPKTQTATGVSLEPRRSPNRSLRPLGFRVFPFVWLKRLGKRTLVSYRLLIYPKPV